jgi:hypothetical protein
VIINSLSVLYLRIIISSYLAPFMASTFYQDYDHQSAKPLPDALLEVFGVSNDGRSGAGDLQRVLEAKRWRFYFIFLIRWLEGAFLEHLPHATAL